MVSISVEPITNADLEKIPVCANELFSQFKIENAEITYIVCVTFPRDYNFYKIAREFLNIETRSSIVSMQKMIYANTNRVHPAIDVPVDPSGYHQQIANIINK